VAAATTPAAKAKVLGTEFTRQLTLAKTGIGHTTVLVGVGVLLLVLGMLLVGLARRHRAARKGAPVRAASGPRRLTPTSDAA
jgi:LPXTG-motif cell wall-anchored protein